MERWFSPSGSAGSLRGGLRGYGLTGSGGDFTIFARGYRATGLSADQVIAWGRGQFDPAPVMHGSHADRIRFDPGPLDVLTGQTYRVGRNYNLGPSGVREIDTPADGATAAAAAPGGGFGLAIALAAALLWGR